VLPAVLQYSERLAGGLRLTGLAEASPAAYAQAGEAYLRGVDAYASGRGRFTDKLPGNIMYAGLIRLLLPHARIVLCRRGALDTGWSIYRQYFLSHNPFAYELEELGGYMALSDDLADHWQDLLGDSLHVVEYEKLVSDFACEARRLVAACGLEWTDDCLRFEDNRRAVVTASATQVRQPLYTSSVGSAEPVSQQLEPMRQAYDSEKAAL